MHVGQVVAIDVLSDNVLLAIFDFYVAGCRYQDLSFLEVMFGNQDMKRKLELWRSLVHVCRRWRGLVFVSPRRLNLQICCDISSRSARKSVDVWPTLPLLIKGNCRRNFCTASQVESLWTAMQVPFPELAGLDLACYASSQFFPIHSWVDLRHVRDSSACIPFHFRDYRNYFCPPHTSFIFTLKIFLIPGTFHPRPWPLQLPLHVDQPRYTPT